MPLTDLIPQGDSFSLALTKRSYRLRPFTLEDEAWLQREFGDRLAEIFQKLRMREILRIAYRIMEDEDKATLAVRNVTVQDEAGEQEVVRMGGIDLLCHLVSGPNEKRDIVQAIVSTLGVSRPHQEKLEKELVEAEKKRLESESIGLTSSTPSQPPTDGPSTRSDG